MRLSSLQKFILKQSWEYRKIKIPRAVFETYYKNKKKKPNKKIQANNITRSIDRLIQRGLIMGYGEKTKHRLYIYEIRLAPAGRKTAKELLGKQTKLPFKKYTK